MAQLFKGHVVNNEQYPLPPGVQAQQRQLAAAAAQQAGEPAPSVDAEEIARAAGDLEQIVSMVSALRPAIEQMTESARSSAQQQGYADGIAQGQAEVQQQLMEAMAALTAAQRERHDHALQQQDALADLALKIARKVIGAHLQADPGIVSRIVADAIAELEPTTSLEVHVNPEDIPMLIDSRAELERLVTGTGSVELIADETVGRGGCVLVSPVGEVDARIETRLEVLEAAFTAQRRKMIDGGAHA